MNKQKLLLLILTVLIALGFSANRAISAQDQNGQEIVLYLEERFKQKYIPVSEIAILSEKPLRLQITVQGTADFVTSEDDENLHTVDREVFVVARQHGYAVDSYVRILVDPHGKKLDLLEQNSKFKYMPVDTSASELSDALTLKLAKDKIDLLSEKYDLQKLPTARIDITSSEGFQTLTLDLDGLSLEEANKALALTQPMYPMIKEMNEGGAQIVMYKVVMTDKDGNMLLNYLFDFQLMTESWRMDEDLEKLATGLFSEPPLAPTP